MNARCDESRDVGHVDQEPGTGARRDLRHALEVDRARVGRAASDEQRGSRGAGQRLDRVVVEQARLAVHGVMVGLEPAPGEVCRGAVAQVPARCEVEAQDPISGAQQREEHRLVRLCARVRLHVGVGRAEELLCPLDGEALDDVDVLAAAVEAPPGVAFERLVADLVPERLAHRAARDVLRGDELDVGALAPRLALERLAHRRS